MRNIPIGAPTEAGQSATPPGPAVPTVALAVALSDRKVRSARGQARINAIMITTPRIDDTISRHEDRFPARRVVREVEGERGGEQDGEEQEHGDRPRRPPPPEPRHAAAKAVTVHNGFPESRRLGIDPEGAKRRRVARRTAPAGAGRRPGGPEPGRRRRRRGRTGGPPRQGPSRRFATHRGMRVDSGAVLGPPSGPTSTGARTPRRSSRGPPRPTRRA